MLFNSTANGIEYQGLSLFFNTGSTAYGGNIIASEEELAAELNAPHLIETARAVSNALETIVAADYRGPLGVDMMLYGPDRLICPTVEINLRTTMGFVALALQRRYEKGILRILPTAALLTLPTDKTILLTPQ